jgi:hypothetical protein
VRSPERCRIASFSESRLSVLIRSPGLRGIIDGEEQFLHIFEVIALKSIVMMFLI